MEHVLDWIWAQYLFYYRRDLHSVKFTQNETTVARVFIRLRLFSKRSIKLLICAPLMAFKFSINKSIYGPDGLIFSARPLCSNYRTFSSALHLHALKNKGKIKCLIRMFCLWPLPEGETNFSTRIPLHILFHLMVPEADVSIHVAHFGKWLTIFSYLVLKHHHALLTHTFVHKQFGLRQWTAFFASHLLGLLPRCIERCRRADSRPTSVVFCLTLLLTSWKTWFGPTPW